jgi:hypothetical protein
MLACAVAVVAGGACRRSAPSPGHAVTPRTDARVETSRPADRMRRDSGSTTTEAAASEDNARAAARLAALLNDGMCRRPRCCVTRVMPAGIGGDGTRYTVVRVDLRPGRGGCAPPQEGEAEDLIDPAASRAQDEGEVDEKDCERYRWDLVAENGDQVTWRQPLEIDHWCRSSFGMGGGEDGMSADAATRTFTFSRANGSSWRGEQVVTFGVDPLRVARTSSRSWWIAGEDDRRVDWNWQTFSGVASTSVRFCRIPDAGDLAAPADAATDDQNEPVAASEEVIIPTITLPSSFVKEEWSTTSLGACAAHVDGGASGFTIHTHGSARGDTGDSEMSVVMSSGGVLFVEVFDDRLVTSAKTWVKADHLELWTSVKDTTPGSGCFQPDPDARALQWGIGLDGQVHKGHAAPADNPTVRVARTEGGARFRIVLPKESHGLTVVYSDSDDGAHQKRLIATSRLVFGRPWTIGAVRPIARQRAVCIADSRQLRPEVATIPRSRNLLLRDLPSRFGDAISR